MSSPQDAVPPVANTPHTRASAGEAGAASSARAAGALSRKRRAASAAGGRMRTVAAASGGNGTAERSDERSVVILGAGIVGAATAYFLTKRGLKPIVIERSGVAAAASGKAGGFLARSWGDGGPTQQLHHKSFDLHEQLAQELGVESYRRIPTLSVAGGARRRGASPPASWLDGDVARAQMMDPGTAQVTPRELTTKLMEAAVAAGATLRIGAACGVEMRAREDGEARVVEGVHVRSGDRDDGEEELIACDTLLVAMGPWTVLAEDWFNDVGAPGPELVIPLEGVKSTSLVYNGDNVRSAVSAEPFALFCAEDRNGCHLEVYPRWNGEVYICGCGGSDYVSGARLRAGGDCEHQSLIGADPKRVAAASSSFAGLTTLARGVNGNATGPDISQACMRPCATDALPIMGQVPGVDGAYLAAGHNCWGILWGPITGLAMAELLDTGSCQEVNLRSFDPLRFCRATRAGGRGGRGRHAGTTAVGEQW